MVEPLSVNIDGGHLFRYPSEVDPRKKATKGGYLTGSVQLPASTDSLRVVLSTYPDTTLQYAQAMADQDPAIPHFHPAILHVIRKKGNYRQFDKEPVPNISMYQQELHIISGQVKIVNRLSRFDKETERNIPAEDDLFTLAGDNCLHLGSRDTCLNMVVLKPKTDKRSTEDDITLNKMISGRILDENLQRAVSEYFNNKNAVNKTRVRINVDVFSLESGKLLGTGRSASIMDTNSKECGAMTIHDISALKSCEAGGRKVFMVSEFSLAKDVQPVFQVWSQEGIRIDEKLEMDLIRQPTEISIVRDTIIFITPCQPNIQVIQENNWMIKVLAKRKSDGFESQAFDFHYEVHNAAQYLKTFSNYSFEFHCIFCDLNPDRELPDSKGLVKVLEVARPGSKRKTMTAKRANPKHYRVSTDSEAGQTTLDSLSPASFQGNTQTFSPANQLSPDSGIESPFPFISKVADENIEFCLEDVSYVVVENSGTDCREAAHLQETDNTGLESAGFNTDYIQELTFLNTVGVADDQAGVLHMDDLSQEVLDEYFPGEIIEKDGKKQNTGQDTIEPVNTDTVREADTVKGRKSRYLAVVSQMKYVPIIFIFILLIFFWKPDISSQELPTAGVGSVILSWLANKLIP
eukprot:GFUD01015671.1.p1 GENE.GFUD01015671.1~~GFUD01015671.1.p1  ORF type:complete len:633 (+),score=203.98 GFUD01015671.1:47-1945(+)